MAGERRRSQAVLKHLRQDSRKTLAAIAREEHVAVSTIFDHVKKLESNIITRFVPLLDHARLGHPFRTFFYCEADDERAIAYLKAHKSTNNLYQLSGGVLAADMVFPSLQEEERCKEALEEHGCTVQQHKVLEPLALEQWTP
ncbi:winged helix-turn-helix transcriptional regulator [Candidatus Woesearchaeota archaeon]|nr:winged helix-turn-helix transcriptional regulator [Candidatus Woesearchaeota archaeon]